MIHRVQNKKKIQKMLSYLAIRKSKATFGEINFNIVGTQQ